jgi:glycerol-3-phosphate O-acyltransferase
MLARLFKFEFRIGSESEREQRFEATLQALLDADQLQLTPTGQVCAGPGQDGWTGQQWLALYTGILAHFLEGYRIAARGLTALLRGPVSSNDLVKKTLALGTRMHLTGEIERREAVSKPTIENAHRALLDQGDLQIADGRLELPESRSTAAAVTSVEARIARWLPERSG